MGDTKKILRRAVIYARVSTDDQAEKGYSLPTQIAACRKYAEANAFRVVAELADDCSGSIPITDRPNGRKVYELVDNSGVDAVIIYTHDRTARDERVIEYLLFKAYLHDRGVDLHYSDTGLDAYTMEGNLVGYIKAHAAAAERLKIRERTRRGKIAKARSGKMIMEGRLPYGGRREGKGREAHIIRCEEELRVVKKIFEWFVNGDGKNGPLSLYRISEKLYDLKISPPGAKGRLVHWGTCAVRRILVNEIYAGRTYYCKSRVVSPGKQVLNPREDWIPIEVSELKVVSQDMFKAAQNRLSHNKHYAARNRHYEYLLAGFLKCGICKRRMYATYFMKRKGGLGFLYKCPHNVDGYHPCPRRGRSVPADKADMMVWNWVVDLLSNDAKLDKGIREMKERRLSEIAPKKQRLEAVNKLIEKAEQKIKRLTDDLSEETDTFAREAIKESRAQVLIQRNSFVEEREALIAELAQRDFTDEDIATIKTTAAIIRRKLKGKPTYEQKRELFDLIHLKAELQGFVGHRKIHVICGLSPEGKRLTIDSQSP